MDTYIVTEAIPPGSFGSPSTSGRARRGGTVITVYCDTPFTTAIPPGTLVKLDYYAATGRYWYVAVQLEG